MTCDVPPCWNINAVSIEREAKMNHVIEWNKLWTSHDAKKLVVKDLHNFKKLDFIYNSSERHGKSLILFFIYKNGFWSWQIFLLICNRFKMKVRFGFGKTVSATVTYVFRLWLELPLVSIPLIRVARDCAVSPLKCLKKHDFYPT